MFGRQPGERDTDARCRFVSVGMPASALQLRWFIGERSRCHDRGADRMLYVEEKPVDARVVVDRDVRSLLERVNVARRQERAFRIIISGRELRVEAAGVALQCAMAPLIPE